MFVRNIRRELFVFLYAKPETFLTGLNNVEYQK